MWCAYGRPRGAEQTYSTSNRTSLYLWRKWSTAVIETVFLCRAQTLRLEINGHDCFSTPHPFEPTIHQMLPSKLTAIHILSHNMPKGKTNIFYKYGQSTPNLLLPHAHIRTRQCVWVGGWGTILNVKSDSQVTFAYHVGWGLTAAGWVQMWPRPILLHVIPCLSPTFPVSLYSHYKHNGRQKSPPPPPNKNKKKQRGHTW